MSTARTIEFFRLIPDARPPKRAERSAAGYLPSRGLRYCDALTSATGFGYWIFPPIDLRLLWDGDEVFWSFGEDEEWSPLSGTDSGAVQFPGYADRFDAAAPPSLQGYSPPLLTVAPEPGGVQIWSGLLARTRPGWSLSIRPPVNLPPIPGLLGWEGLIETDIWFGPLFTNVRLTRTNSPVVLRRSTPFMQVQPVPQLAYREEVLSDYACREAADLREEDWAQFGSVVARHTKEDERLGAYAVQVRKRRSCPFNHATLAPE